MSKNTPKLNARLGWNHHFKSMIHMGEIRKIGVYGYSVLSVIKSYSDFKTGKAIVHQRKIADLIGASVRQVQREIEKLERLDYLTRTGKKGRTYIYQVREKVHFMSDEGMPHAAASWPYIPTKTQTVVNEMKQFIETGKVSGKNLIHIENLQININDYSTNVIASLGELDTLPANLKDKLLSMISKSAERKTVKTYTHD